MHDHGSVRSNDVAHNASNMIEAVTSLYICVPGLIACAADMKAIRKFSQFEQGAWFVLVVEFWWAAAASTIAWYKWTAMTGTLDRACAAFAVLGSLMFGILRGRRVCIGPLCVLLGFLCLMTYFLEDVLLQHSWREPWPHFTFRYFACSLTSMSIGAEVVYRSLPEMLVAVAILALIGYSHAFLQLYMMETSPGWHWSRRSYVTELCKSVAPMLLAAYLMVKLPRGVCIRGLEPEKDISTSSSEEESSTALDSSDDAEAANRKEDCCARSCVCITGQL